MTELESLLFELKKLQKVRVDIPTTKDTWLDIKKDRWAELGFQTKEEAESWLEQHQYENL